MKKIKVLRKILVVLLIVSLLPINNWQISFAKENKETVKSFLGDGYEITVEEKSSWNDGYIAEFKLKNKGTQKIKNWNVTGYVDGTIESVWNVGHETNGSEVTFTYEGWNRTIPVNGEVNFGMKVNGASFNTLEGLRLYSLEKVKMEHGYDVEFKIRNQWNNNAIIDVTVFNTGDLNIVDWDLAFDMDAEIDNIWNGEIVSHEENTYKIENMGYNADIAVGGNVTFGFQASFKDASSIQNPINEILSSVKRQMYPSEDMDDDQEDADWNRKMIQADTDLVAAARDNVQDVVKIGLIDSGVDFTEDVNVVARKDFINGDDEERTPLFEDESGHGSAAAAILASSASNDGETEEDWEEDETEADYTEQDFSYLDDSEIITLTPKLSDEVRKLIEESEEYDTEEYDDGEDEDDSEYDEEDEENENDNDDELSLYDILQEDGRTITGINPNVEIYSAKVLDENNEAPTNRIVEGIEWAIEQDVNILHLGFSIEKDIPALREVVKKAYKKGILIVAAAGNGETVEYPAKYKEVMAVGSVNCEGEKAEQSAVGAEIEVVAPGENVYSVGPFGVIDTFSGTSMAVPQVVGLASLLWQKDIDKSNEFIRQLIIVTANNIGDGEQYGYGIVDCDYALRHYDDFTQIYSEKNSIEDSIDEVREEGVIEENEMDLETFNEDVVIGRWKGAAHKGFAGSLQVVKNGAIWQDNEKSSGLYGMTKYPGFHGYRLRSKDENNKDLNPKKENDYIASYLYLTKQAVKYGSSGTYHTDLSETNVSGKGLSFTHKKFKANIGKAWNTYKSYTTKSQKALFVYGMAIHTATDIYAHSTYRHEKVKDINYISNTWKHITHKKEAADNTDSGKDLRYKAAKTVSKNILKNISATKVTKGSAKDFNGGNTYKNPKKILPKNRATYLKKAFSIKDFSKYVSKHTSDNNTLVNVKRIDHGEVLSVVKKWTKTKTASAKLGKAMSNMKVEAYNEHGQSLGPIVNDDNITMFLENESTSYLKVTGWDVNNPSKRLVCTKQIRCSQGDDSLFLENDEYQVMCLESDLELTEQDIVTADLKGKVTVAGTGSNQSNDNVLPDANVRLMDYNDNSYVLTTVTDVGGMYSFTDIAPGIYTMTIQKEGYLEVQYTVIVRERETNVYNPVVAMISTKYEGKGNASGKVVNAATAKGVEGLTLRFRSGIGELKKTPVAEIKTGSGGNYEISQLEAGHYTVQIVDERGDEEVRYSDGIMNVMILGGYTISDQNGVVSCDLDNDQLRIVLTWGAAPRDLDSHLIGVTSEGDDFHVYYANKVAGSNGDIEAMLDVDVTSGYGPETTTIYKPLDEVYDFYVYNFTRDSVNGLANSGAMVQVYKGDSDLPWYTFYVPQGQGYYWNVFSYDGGTGKITPYGYITMENEFY